MATSLNHDHSASLATRAHQASGLGDGGQRVAPCRLARGQQVLIEIDKDHERAAPHATKDRLGPDDPGVNGAT